MMPTLAPDVQEVTAPIEALTVWLSRPDTKRQMQTAVSEAVAAVEQHIVNDTSLRVPRQKSERQDGFRPWLDVQSYHFNQWLASYKRRLADRIQSEVLSAFPETFGRLQNKDMVRETVETLIWPEVEPLLRKRAEDLLRAYAVRGIALPWVSRNLADTLLLGRPEAQNNGWRVPLHDPLTRTQVAEIVLDRDGEVLSDVQELRTALQLHP